MGTYLNPGNEMFAKIVRSGRYVDKTGLLAYLNDSMRTEKHLIASSRPRRFGKTLAVRMMEAYYSKGCDSEKIFEALEIENVPSFQENLNKYDVISLDIQAMNGIVKDLANDGDTNVSLLPFIRSKLLEELREAYPDCVDSANKSVADAMTAIHKSTGSQFIIIIDEWDCVFREEKENKALQEEYINFLRSLFKGALSDRFLRLAYITGILPIKKYGTQSALNNFRELTMVSPGGIAKYIGFTEEEVKTLCQRHNSSFEKMRKWYDGYYLSKAGHIYCPNSVMEAIDNEEFANYWSQTETYEDLKYYIEMDFDRLRQMVIDMLGGEKCRIHTQSFQNDMTSFKSASDVLTLLVHLGYLAYDSQTKEAFIPNEEVRDTFVLSVMDGDWGEVYSAIRDSEKLLAATLAMDGDAVAEMIEEVHRKNSSSLVYNNEISLASIIRVAYYSAVKDYTLIRELPTGEGFADMAFIPKRHSHGPALLIELKWNKSAESAMKQIRDKKYTEALAEYKGNLLLVGISYDKSAKGKKHKCVITRA